ncbi:hypothetical protein CHY_2500 [Carboxydothermus hydrogenoformans Z-2901]|uniref:Uncharacterized protein n=1 Tax=Carboxydothermus hydrogenoformans (strain ATCC BAA-161 / DSM 6008 / Z-2901) TaxID=246194 RepID=Q3A990_CARHZ|nr:hypothetical protein CHY_2500 [Carboxydothermus hydrogenoformans Z-2901]
MQIFATGQKRDNLAFIEKILPELKTYPQVEA